MCGIFRPKAWERDPEGRLRFRSHQHGGVNVAKIRRDSVGSKERCVPRKNTIEHQYLKNGKKINP